MLLRSTYNLMGVKDSSGLVLPLLIEVNRSTRASILKQDDGHCLVIDRKINAGNLKVTRTENYYRKLPDGSNEPVVTLELVGDDDSEVVTGQDIISGLVFLTDHSLSLAAPLGSKRFVAETKEDEKLLDDFGTDEKYTPASGHVSVRSFNANVTTETFQSLLSKSAGLRLYSNAMKADFATAQFRELWRVLESAFGQGDDELVTLLTQYVPAQKLEFNKSELEQLLVLRGRASHAQSRAGVKELAYVDRRCVEQLPRLKNLCERVILTKKSWGYPTLATEEILPLAGFIGPDSR